MNIKPQNPIHLGNTPHGIAYRVFCDDDNYGDVTVKIIFHSKDDDKVTYKQRFDAKHPFTDHYVPKEVIPRKATLIFITYSLRNSEGSTPFSDPLVVYNPFMDNPHPWEGNLEYTAKMLEGDIDIPHMKETYGQTGCTACLKAFVERKSYLQHKLIITQQELTSDSYYL